MYSFRPEPIIVVASLDAGEDAVVVTVPLTTAPLPLTAGRCVEIKIKSFVARLSGHTQGTPTDSTPRYSILDGSGVVRGGSPPLDPLASLGGAIGGTGGMSYVTSGAINGSGDLAFTIQNRNPDNSNTPSGPMDVLIEIHQQWFVGL